MKETLERKYEYSWIKENLSKLQQLQEIDISAAYITINLNQVKIRIPSGGYVRSYELSLYDCVKGVVDPPEGFKVNTVSQDNYSQMATVYFRPLTKIKKETKELPQLAAECLAFWEADFKKIKPTFRHFKRARAIHSALLAEARIVNGIFNFLKGEK